MNDLFVSWCAFTLFKGDAHFDAMLSVMQGELQKIVSGASAENRFTSRPVMQHPYATEEAEDKVCLVCGKQESDLIHLTPPSLLIPENLPPAA
jgi:hypothetical protein